MQNLAPDERRSERAAFETEDYVISGTITLPRSGYLSRLSDYLNRTDIIYIPLVDVERVPRNGKTASKHPFLALRKAHVHCAYSLEDPDQDEDSDPDA